ncbi:MAG: LysM peptidoglycan-binding domain-containing protein [Spirochaetia bacterium]|nr:LysM peptidoglycan-binding domain-containing protein [Spirochaetia bacterium]
MIVQWWMFLFFILVLFFSTVVFSNPFDSFENELKDYIDSENNQNSELDPEIRDLFQPENKEEDEFNFKKSYSNGNIRLPSHINVSRLISTTVIKSEKNTSTTYKVKAKDTLSSIAGHYNLKVETIKQLNKLKSDNIRIGQILNLSVPRVQTASTIYKMKVFALPVVTAKVSSRFGYRRDPFNPNVNNFHSGLDLSAPVGTPVIASADGIIEFKGRNGGYGNTVIIRHKDGYKTIYAHCSTTTVEIGEEVKMGTVIGSVGRTGTATGAHLHFEVMQRGKFINPESALQKIEIVTAKAPQSNKS